MPTENNIQWPAIAQYLIYACIQITETMKTAHHAAGMIAAMWRKHNRGWGIAHGPMLYTTINDLKHTLGGDATAKLDGTNVGKGLDGGMYGRRWEIPENEKMYQNTPLDAVHAADIGAVRDGLATALGDTTSLDKATRFVVYGELMCNLVYNYAAAGLGGSWLAFGAVLQFTTEDDANAFVTDASHADFAPSHCDHKDESDDVWKVLLCASPQLRALFQGAGLMVPDEVGVTTSDDKSTLVVRAGPFMSEKLGEGVVIKVTHPDGTNHLYKWKIGEEHQPGSRKILQKTLKALVTDPAAEMLGPYIEVVPLLWKILEKTGGGETRRAVGGAGGAERKVKKQAHDKQQRTDYEAALKSAMTKRDLAHHFAASEDTAATVRLLTDELCGEIYADMVYETGSKDAKRVKKWIGCFVGKQFGAWKKSVMTSSSST